MQAITKKDSPGVLIPPPLIFVAIFLASMILQRIFPLSQSFFYSSIAANLGIVCIICSIVFIITAFIRFIQSRNTIITFRPANSLETKGIYSITRNPMYFGLLLMYLGIAIVKGSWWTFMLIPLLIFIMQAFIIKKEEAYLQRTFGQEYTDYKKKVRRWI